MANFNTKKEMAEALARRKNISKVKAKEMVEDVVGVIEEMILDETHDGLDIYGMFRIEVKGVPETIRRNPKDGSTVVSPAHNRPVAKISSSLKKKVK